jgi:hypothetical protein
MFKKLLIATLPFVLFACTSNPAAEPKSWKKDLDGVQEENINTDITQITKDVLAPQPQVMTTPPKKYKRH